MPDEASARRFVPDAMHGRDIGTLNAQQRCGTVQGQRTASSPPVSAVVPEPLVCGPVETHSGDHPGDMQEIAQVAQASLVNLL